MNEFDVLIVTALELEYEAARESAHRTPHQPYGVTAWEECDTDSNMPYLRGIYLTSKGEQINIALARPTRMGGIPTVTLASALVERLRPRCIAMCGVCAGNPGDVVLGDVIIAEMAYYYDEGKLKSDGFEGDHRQTPMLDTWVRVAQEVKPEGLPSFGTPVGDEPKYWLLERLYLSENPLNHPARRRYFPVGSWQPSIEAFIKEDLIRLNAMTLELTETGRHLAETKRLFDVDPPAKLPFAIKVGPMASGNVVVKDGLTWENLVKWGVRSVIGLEMEAAAIGAVAHRSGLREWIVVKGVMDYADPRKNDRHKPFAARASAEVLYRLLSTLVVRRVGVTAEPATAKQIPNSSALVPLHTQLTIPEISTTRIEEVLFDIYSKEFEKYYFIRKFDTEIETATRLYGVWLFGASGSGKTTLIRHLINAKGIESLDISLSLCGNSRECLFEICQSIFGHFGASEQLPKRLSSAMQATRKLLINHLMQNDLWIYIDEIPLVQEGDMTRFTRSLIGLFGNSRVSTSKFRLLISSIYGPTSFLSSVHMRIHERIKIIESAPWSNQDIESFLVMLTDALKIGFDASQGTSIVKSAEGSPRFVKLFLRNYLAYGSSKDWSKVLEQTIHEWKGFQR